MRSEGPSELARGNRAAFLRATIASAATLAAVVAMPKEAPAFGEFGGAQNASGYPWRISSERVMNTGTSSLRDQLLRCSYGTAPTCL